LNFSFAAIGFLCGRSNVSPYPKGYVSVCL